MVTNGSVLKAENTSKGFVSWYLQRDVDNRHDVNLFSREKTLKARLHMRFLSPQLNATQCNFCRAEVATSCDFTAILVQFVSVNASTRLLLKQKLCAC